MLGFCWGLRAASCHLLLPSSTLDFTLARPLCLSQFVIIILVIIERPLGVDAAGTSFYS